jgi:hypothetical protein
MWKVQLAFSRTSWDAVLGHSEEPVIYPAHGNARTKTTTTKKKRQHYSDENQLSLGF